LSKIARQRLAARSSRPPPVDPLESLKEHQQLLEVVEGQLIVDRKEGVGHGVGDVVVEQVGAQLIDVGAQLVHLPEAGPVDAEHQAVDLAPVLEEVGGHLAGDEGPRKVGDLQRPIDGVVVGDGHEVHTSAPTGVVDLARIGEALRGADAA
jgi:hypothetical protein